MGGFGRQCLKITHTQIIIINFKFKFKLFEKTVVNDRVN